jgi:predicted small lipoprotein YifL
MTCAKTVFGQNAGMKSRFVSVPVAIMAFFSLTGCGDDPQLSQPAPAATAAPAVSVPATGPAITASPNPVSAKGGPTGSTTIAWNTGAGTGEIFLSTNGTNEKLFARGEKGSQEAPWIAAGITYEFRLYNAGDHSQILAKVIVTRDL